MSLSIIRCSHCRLNQYRTQSGKCRKCHSFFEPQPVLYMCPEVPPCPSDLFHSFGLAVKLIRLSKKLSQRELGQRIGSARTRISRVERGEFNRRGLRWDHAETLICSLDVSLYQFFLLVGHLNAKS